MSHPHIDSSNSTPALPHLAPTCAILIQPSVPILTSGASFTDAQVDEYREQDRWLPVRPKPLLVSVLLESLLMFE